MNLKFPTKFRTGILYIQKHPQLIVTCLILILIPLSFLFAVEQFMKASVAQHERLERARITLLHDILGAQLEQSSFVTDARFINELSSIVSRNPDIREIGIALENQNQILVKASSRVDAVGSVIEDATPFTLSNAAQDTMIFERSERGERIMSAYRSFPQDDGTTVYVYSESALSQLSIIFRDQTQRAYIWLCVILGLLILVVIRQVRLIDYAHLYTSVKQANQMKDLFTNMIAHELRAPLTAIRGYASMLRESEKNPALQKNAQNIEDAASRLVLLINDLLDVARLQSGKMGFKAERTNVVKTIQTVIETMHGAAQEKSITLLNDVTASEVFAIVDERRLIQALTNLSSNAIKYTKSGKIAISLDERSDRIEIRVKDTGMGMSAEDQKHLFAPFFRVENTETQGVVGTGLGMWITKQLIELMKGSIGVESIKGVGTHIVITLPK